MKIKDWDVWHVYSSFLDVGAIDLEAAALELVRSKLAVCVLHRDGKTWWVAENEVKTGFTRIEMNAQKIGANITIEPDDNNNDLDDYSLEAWYQASYFRFSEMKLCREGPNPAKYIRVVLGEFHLTSTESGFGAVIYPIVKLFEDGVILVEFRIMSPERKILISEFINRHVNFSLINFNEVKVPPAVAVISASAYFHSTFNIQHSNLDLFLELRCF